MNCRVHIIQFVTEPCNTITYLPTLPDVKRHKQPRTPRLDLLAPVLAYIMEDTKPKTAAPSPTTVSTWYSVSPRCAVTINYTKYEIHSC